MRVNYKNTPENYRAMVEIIIPPLLDLLKSLTLLEEEIFERNKALDKEKEALGIPANQVHPKWNDLMDEYFQRQIQLYLDWWMGIGYLMRNSTVLMMRKLGISTYFEQDSFASQLI